MLSCLEKGEEVIVPEPLYANYIGFSNMADVQLCPITSTIETGFALPGVEAFEAAIGPNTRGIFICNPNNPTGAVYSREVLEQIGQLALKHDLFLFVDEVYREFCYDESFFSVLNLQNPDEHILVIDSVSKVFSACGIRVGFVVSRNQSLMTNILKYAQLRLCPPMIGQHIAEACYIGRKEYLDQVKAEYNSRRLYLHKRLSSMKDVNCYMPKAAFYIMTGLPVADANVFCKWLLTDFERDRKTVMFAPGDGFYLSAGMGVNQVRIAFVLGGDALAESMDLLEEALTVYQGVDQQRLVVAEMHD